MTISTWFRQAWVLVVALALLVGSIAPVQAQNATAVRVLSIDGDTGALTVLDGTSGETVGHFSGAAPGFVVGTGSSTSRYFVVNYYDGNKTVLVDSGLHQEPHGDHVDLHQVNPFVRVTMDAQAPAHYWARDGIIAIANDGASTVTIFNEGDLAATIDPVTVTLATDEPDHVSIAVLGETLFVGYYASGAVQSYALDGTLLNDNLGTCPGTHGETLVGDQIAFACDDGILLLSEESDNSNVVKLPYPEGSADQSGTGATPVAESAPLRSNLLTAATGSTVFAGDSARGVLLFDAATGEVSVVDLSSPVVYLEYATDGSQVTALTADGMAHGIDPLAATVVWSTAAATPYSSFGPEEANSFYPFTGNAAGQMFLADPGAGEVVVLNLGNGEIVNRFAVDGRPARVVVVAAEGVSH